MVKLRLKRYGKKREPSYRIVAIDSHARRQARPLQELGFYNPRTKETVLRTQDLLKWLRYGAQPTDTLDAILKKAGVYEMLKAGGEGVAATVRIPAVVKTIAAVVDPVADTDVESELAPEAVGSEPIGLPEVLEDAVTEAIQPEAEDEVIQAVAQADGVEMGETVTVPDSVTDSAEEESVIETTVSDEAS